MKDKLIICMTILSALFFTACGNNDTAGDPPKGPEGEETVVSLTIYDGTAGPSVRAAGGETDAPVGKEAVINPTHGIKVVVFNEDGTLAYPLENDPIVLSITETGIGTGKYKSDRFKINSGNKYFYIFANDGNGTVTKPDLTILRDEFISKTTAAVLDAADVLNITSPDFLMGTLWSEKKIAPAGGMDAAPKNISLIIGRLSAKVTVTNINQGTSNMSGTFSEPEYRLGTIPKSIFLVGNNDENTDAPPAFGHGVVTSAVHTSSEATDYQDYTNTWKSPGVHFYTIENTTVPVQGIQYYGNTTYIQIRSVYTPDDAEVYNPDLTPAGTFTGPTFYTARVTNTGETVIFELDPRTTAGHNPSPNIDQNSIREYKNGMNYHKFPIYDKEAGLPEVQKHAVLRNHSYIYEVKNILYLGSPEDDVSPLEPVETPTTLTLQVEVAPWSMIIDDDITI